MTKKNKWKLLLSSVVILLPSVFGLIFWNELPEQMVTHWGWDGNADGWSNRIFVVFALPLFILFAHWFCLFCTSRDPKNKNQSDKIFRIILWICPITSLFASGMIYATAFGKTMDIDGVLYMLVGLFFIVIGNYLPKCKQNHTIGIKVKWALENEENWNATHRFSGKVWIIGGVLMLACAFFPKEISMYVFMILIIGLSILSGGYSYYYFRTKRK